MSALLIFALSSGIVFAEEEIMLPVVQKQKLNLHPVENKQTKQNHGTTRANFHNAVVGVSQGYKKELEMKGIGYKAQMQGNDIVLWAGYSHTVTIKPNEGVKISTPSATEIHVEGIDKQAVGQTAARIREVRPPEPYLGKGIRYKTEVVHTKEGKRASAGGKK